MRRRILVLASLGWIGLMACSFSLIETPTPIPTQPATPTPTLIPPCATLPIPSSTATVTATATSAPQSFPKATSPTETSGIVPGFPSGPYSVILVAANDVLNIRSGPGVGNDVVGSFPPTFTAVMRTGPSSKAGEAWWVEVQNPSGGKGWVNAKYLTEYVAPSVFCSDAQVTPFLQSLKTAIVNSNGELLASLVSPAHGMDVRKFRAGRVVNYDGEHAEFVFGTTFEVNWGLASGSGQEVKGSFQDAIVPDLLKVFAQPYTLHCNELKYGGVTYSPVWPYPGTHFYSAFFNGTEVNGNMDWHTWVIGIEYVSGKPYVFALVQFFWEP